MLEEGLGKKQTLAVVKKTEFGVYLGTEEERVLLPRKQVPEGTQVGDEIEVNALSELDGYSKDQVYNLRKRYIFRSMFKSDSYNPNEKIFGGKH